MGNVKPIQENAIAPTLADAAVCSLKGGRRDTQTVLGIRAWLLSAL
jgi:hypothetical protein